MLQIKKINSGYNGAKVLKNVSIEALPNEITLIIGPNGSGKSTILKTIYNMTSIYSGNIKLEDISLNGLKPYELINLGISFVLQRNVVFGTLSVLENLNVASNKYHDKNIAKKEIQKVLKLFPFLEKMKSDKASSLSGGEQRQLAIAMAFLQNPKVLLLDEPSVGLSVKAVKEVFNMIKQIRDEGVIILLVEQNVNLASKIANKIYVLEQGKIAHFGNRNILKDKKIKEVYLG